MAQFFLDNVTFKYKFLVDLNFFHSRLNFCVYLHMFEIVLSSILQDKITEIKSALLTVVHEEVQTLKDTIKQLKEENKELKEENEKLKQKVTVTSALPP